MALISYLYLFFAGAISIFGKDEKKSLMLVMICISAFLGGIFLLTDIVNTPFFIVFSLAPLLILIEEEKTISKTLTHLGIVILLYYLIRSMSDQNYFLELFICEIAYLHLRGLSKESGRSNTYNFHYSIVRIFFIVLLFCASYFLESETTKLFMIITQLGLTFLYIYPALNFESEEKKRFEVSLNSIFVPATLIYVTYEMALKINYLNYVKLQNIYLGFSSLVVLFQLKRFVFNEKRDEFKRADLLTSFCLIISLFLLNQRITIELCLSFMAILILIYEIYIRTSNKFIKYFCRNICLITPLNPIFFLIINECRKDNLSISLKIMFVLGILLNQIYFFYKKDNGLKDGKVINKQIAYLSTMFLLVVIYIYDKV